MLINPDYEDPHEDTFRLHFSFPECRGTTIDAMDKVLMITCLPHTNGLKNTLVSSNIHSLRFLNFSWYVSYVEPDYIGACASK